MFCQPDGWKTSSVHFHGITWHETMESSAGAKCYIMLGEPKCYIMVMLSTNDHAVNRMIHLRILWGYPRGSIHSGALRNGLSWWIPPRDRLGLPRGDSPNDPPEHPQRISGRSLRIPEGYWLIQAYPGGFLRRYHVPDFPEDLQKTPSTPQKFSSFSINQARGPEERQIRSHAPEPRGCPKGLPRRTPKDTLGPSKEP